MQLCLCPRCGCGEAIECSSQVVIFDRNYIACSRCDYRTADYDRMEQAAEEWDARSGILLLCRGCVVRNAAEIKVEQSTEIRSNEPCDMCGQKHGGRRVKCSVGSAAGKH